MNGLITQAQDDCGFAVSNKMREVWAVELDILEHIKDVCARHGIKWYVVDGTLLGAVRHKGFIPWDDDIDIGMPRADYNRFVEVAQKELGEPYFVQTHWTERRFPFDMAKVRNSNTTGFIENGRLNGWNLGIFVDVFPIDEDPDDPDRRKASRDAMVKTIRRLDLLTRDMVHGPGAFSSVKHLLKGCLRLAPDCFRDRLFCELVEEARRYNGHGAQWCGERAFNQTDRYRWRTEDCAEVVELPFEGTIVFAPAGYERVLDDIYGDWRIPAVEDSCHSGVIYEPGVPYAAYVCGVGISYGR